MPQDPVNGSWKVLVAAGVVLVIAGLLLRALTRTPFPMRLPGDFVFRGKHVTVFVPLATSLLLSLLLTLILNLLHRR